MNPPNDRELNQMLVDQQMGIPFTGPEEWLPVWDQLGLELAEAPDGAVIDVPFDSEAPDLTARAEGIRLVSELAEAMEPTPEKVVCWRAGTASLFPPDGDPTPYVGETYQEAGFVSVTTHQAQVVVPEGGHLLAVVVPAGIPAVFDPADKELVLKPGLNFRVVSVAPDGTVKVVVEPEKAPEGGSQSGVV